MTLFVPTENEVLISSMVPSKDRDHDVLHVQSLVQSFVFSLHVAMRYSQLAVLLTVLVKSHLVEPDWCETSRLQKEHRYLHKYI